MFEMYKYILAKVSFDKNIFKKELTKAFKRLKEDEKVELKNWCVSNFDHQYNGLLEEVFHSNRVEQIHLCQQNKVTIAA